MYDESLKIISDWKFFLQVIGLHNQQPEYVDVNIVSNDILDTDRFRSWIPEYANAEFILEDGKYVCGWAVEKMSKSVLPIAASSSSPK